MIKLNKSTLIGKGLHREVHQHPQDSNLCIKIVVNGDEKETLREQSYYQLLQNRRIVWQSLPKFYGNIDTNRGKGAVFDLIRDDEGQVSKTVEHYLQSNPDKAFLVQIEKALSILRADLLKQNIVTMTLHPKNMVLQQHKDGVRCLIVDNIGTSEFFPLSIRVRYFGRLKIERKWQRLILLIKKQYGFDL